MQHKENELVLEVVDVLFGLYEVSCLDVEIEEQLSAVYVFNPLLEYLQHLGLVHLQQFRYLLYHGQGCSDTARLYHQRHQTVQVPVHQLVLSIAV